MQPKYPNPFSLISLLLSLPSSSVDAERGFSRMKIQKSDWRARLGDHNLSDLMLISMQGDEFGQYDPDPAINLREQQGTRARRPFFNDIEKQKVSNVTRQPEPQAEVEDQAAQLQDEIVAECGELDEDDYDDDMEDKMHRQDIISLQQKAYKMLLSMM